jgi:tetratricopeptide (TPR) repeat protein
LLSYAYHYRGIVRDHLQDYYNALRDLDRALQLDPFNDEIFVSRGAVKLHMQSYLWSLNDFDSAIRINSKNILAYSNRAVARATLRDYDGALEDCSKAIQLDPYNAEAYLKRGIIKADMENYAGAKEDLSYSIRLKDNVPYTWFNRALANIHLGDTTSAIDDFSTVLELDPYNALTFYNRGLLLSQTRDYYGALEDYNKVLMLNPDNIYTYYNRAIIKHLLEDYRGAITDYTSAIKLFPGFAGAYLNRSDARERAGDDKGAYLDYQKALSIINRVNSADFDSLLVQEYADSAYFSRIIEFEADFVALTLKEDVIPDRSIDLEPGFLIIFAPDDYLFVEKSRLGYISPRLEDLNEQMPLGLRMIYANKIPEWGEEQANALLKSADSLVLANPYSARAYFFRGVINSMIRNFQTALKDYDMALFIDPEMGLAYLNRSWIHFEMAEHSTFEARYSTPATITWGEQPEPADVEPPLSPDYSKAMSDLDHAARLMPGLPFPFINRGNLKVRLKDYTGAVGDFTEAANKRPRIPEPWFNRALTLLFLQNNKLACEDLSEAGERGLQAAYEVIGRYCK